MMSWICDRCGKADTKMQDGEAPTLIITVSLMPSVIRKDRMDIEDRKEVCFYCFDEFTEIWKKTPTERSEG